MLFQVGNLGVSIPNYTIQKQLISLNVEQQTVCYYHVAYEFQSESRFYSLPECQGTPCSKQAPYLKFNISARLRTKWLWVSIPLLSLKLQIWRLLRVRSSLKFRQKECGFLLKLVRDIVITYSQTHRTDKYSQHSSIICLVWLNG